MEVDGETASETSTEIKRVYWEDLQSWIAVIWL